MVMRKALGSALALVVLLVLPGMVHAQGGRGAGMMQSTARLLLDKKADLGLSDEVAAKLDTIAIKLEAKNAPIREELRTMRESGAGRDAMMAKARELRAADTEVYEKEIKPLLTPAQVEQADKIIETARPRRPGGRPR
jgi:uncharacterized coiled-coil DUF342 family protein